MRILVCLSILLLTAACGSLIGDKEKSVTSSLVEYLYPDGNIPDKVLDSTPTLKLPLRIGVAFLPDKHGTSTFPEADKMRLLGTIKEKFTNIDYVKSIETIPSNYIANARGFEGLQQVTRLLGLDVIALISYDQLTRGENNRWSFMYLTIVGAYIFEGDDVDIRSFMDISLFDTRTQKLLLRAPGIDATAFDTNAADVRKKTNDAKRISLEKATADLIKNLDTELAQFETRVKKSGEVKIVTANGEKYEGRAGSFDFMFLTIGLLAAGLRSRKLITRK